jgi:hypothetical protein
MHISFEGKLGLWLGLTALFSGGLEVRPEHVYLGYALLAIAGIGTIFLIWYHFCEFLKLKWGGGRKQKMIAIMGMVGSAAAFLGFTSAYFWAASLPPVTSAAKPSKSPGMTIHDLFLDDFQSGSYKMVLQLIIHSSLSIRKEHW